MSDWDSVPILVPGSASASDTPQAGQADSLESSAEQMPAEIETSPVVHLGDNPVARDVRDALLALQHVETATVDASKVERLAAPVLQVLLAAFKEAASHGSKIAVRNPSFAFTLAFEAFGLGGDNEPFIVEYN
jgi:anti-anti-sigma regulatory factor